MGWCGNVGGVSEGGERWGGRWVMGMSPKSYTSFSTVFKIGQLQTESSQVSFNPQ